MPEDEEYDFHAANQRMNQIFSQRTIELIEKQERDNEIVCLGMKRMTFNLILTAIGSFFAGIVLFIAMIHLARYLIEVGIIP